jgi:hypothetical protein
MSPEAWITLAVSAVAVPLLGHGVKYMREVAEDTAAIKRRVLGDPRYGIPSLVDQIEDHEERITKIERKVA